MQRPKLLLTNLGFEANYQVEHLDGRPGDGVRQYPPLRMNTGPGDRVLDSGSGFKEWIGITPNGGKPWHAGFEISNYETIHNHIPIRAFYRNTLHR